MLLELDAGAGRLELRFGLLGVFLADLLEDRLGGGVDHVLGLLQPEAGEGADLLDHLDLLVAGGDEDDIELVLLLLGGGGVDFLAVFKVLRDKHYKGWAIFDVDGPRKGDDGFDSIGGNLDVAVDDYIAHNINYLRDVLGVRLPPPG